jgi:hypothetical protein
VWGGISFKGPTPFIVNWLFKLLVNKILNHYNF